MNTSSQVSKVYKTVVEDVINNVKEAFLDEGVDEQVLLELRQLWEGKLAASKAMEAKDENSAIAPRNVVVLPQPVTTNIKQGAAALAPAVPGQHNQQFQQSASAATATLALPTGLFQQQLAALGAGGQIQNITVQQTGNGQFITLAGLPAHFQQQQPRPRIHQQITTQMIHHQEPQQTQQSMRLPIQPNPVQQQQTAQRLVAAPQHLQPSQTTLSAQAKVHQNMIQLDGNGDTSSSDEDFDDDDKDDEKEDENEEEEQGEEDEPLNSADDVSEEDPNELFDTDNVVVCQFDKINRNKNRWKFHLKDGIMNLNGKDFVFQKATGDSEW